jgi:hypothetical protein
MLHLWTTACLLIAGLIAAAIPVHAQGESWTGFSWGMTRTYWSADKNSEGYPRAGTAATVLGLERTAPLTESLEFAPYFRYQWMRSTVTTLICDTCYGETRTDRTYYREIDLGFNFNCFPLRDHRHLYLGAGPSVRWGQAGSYELGTERPGEVLRAAWFGLSVLGGYRSYWGEHLAVMFEPQLTFSPDEADRWQRVCPPDNLTLQMGMLWK